MRTLSVFALVIFLFSGNALACSEREKTKTAILTNRNQRVPGCFEAQVKLLKELGFPGPFASDEIRIFILQHLLTENSLFGEAFKSLAASTDPEVQKLRRELEGLRYTISQIGNSHRGPDVRVTSYLSSINMQWNSCTGKPPHCFLEIALQKNRNELKAYIARRWKQLQAAPAVRTVGKRIPEGKLGSREARDFGTVEVAHELFLLGQSAEFTPADWQKIVSLNSIYEETIAPFYAGRNALTKSMETFSLENTLGPMIPLSVDHVVRTFSTRKWLGGPAASDITAETSRSPLLDLFGPGSRRITFWPWDTMEQPLELGTGATRYSEIYDENGILRAIEVIARDFFLYRSGIRVDESWEPFVYEERWGRWFPSQKVKETPVRNFCITCHVAPNGNFSPLPNNANTFSDLKAVGYKEDDVIHDLLRFRSAP